MSGERIIARSAAAAVHRLKVSLIHDNALTPERAELIGATIAYLTVLSAEQAPMPEAQP